MPGPLLRALAADRGGEALRVGSRALPWPQLRAAVAATARELGGARRAAVWAVPEVDTCIAVAGCLVAGVAGVPLNPAAGPAELAHVLADSRPDLLLAPAGAQLPAGLDALPRVAPAAGGRASLPDEPEDGELPALIIYTSGTTGPPKGAVLPRRALAADLDALAEAWAWTPDDVLVHGLPLFHVHGLVLGVLGALRVGSRLHHVGRFSPAALAAAQGSLVFGVPTMWSRVAADPPAARALRNARLLVSGSAGLPRPAYDALAALAGRGPVERWGLTETLINTAARADQPATQGRVGPPLRGVEVRLAGDHGGPVAPDDEEVGEVLVRGPNLFTGYLNRPDATGAAVVDGWFRTGDLATVDGSGSLRILGRRATDLIKTGGYKVGAGEVESALLAHPGVSEAAVRGLPDADLGERIVAWVVRADPGLSARALADHVAVQLAPHKRPRAVIFTDSLPRNAMGKVVKARLEV